MKCVGVCLLLVGFCLGVLGDEKSKEDCECVPYYRCLDGLTNIGENGILEIRTINNSCQHILDVCCKKQIRTTFRPECGNRNPEGVSVPIDEAVDGQAQFGEFPWMVALLQEKAVNGTEQLLSYLCGGSLIHPKVVLTAAQCVRRKPVQELKIRAGEWDPQTTSELFPHQDRTVAQVIVHENFNMRHKYNDIALLILHDPVTAADNVDVVCLPSQGEVFDHTRCFVSGWGTNISAEPVQDDAINIFVKILKKIELPIVPSPACLNALRQTHVRPDFNLHESFICAGGEPNRDTCMGDAGSPLVCPYKDDPLHYQQVGIVSWGVNLACGRVGLPGGYVNIAKFRNWIDEKMTAANLNSSSYIH